MSRCFRGLKVSLPRRLAVSSPSIKATLPWEYSCTVNENNITGVINSNNWVLSKITSKNPVRVYEWLEAGVAETVSGGAKGNKERHFLAKTALLDGYFTVNGVYFITIKSPSLKIAPAYIFLVLAYFR
jgi:hypothetical protein